MKALHVRRLYLWPRFQAQARQDLEARPPQVRDGGAHSSRACRCCCRSALPALPAAVLLPAHTRAPLTPLTLFTPLAPASRLAPASWWS